MKNKFKILFTIGFIIAVFCIFGISASALGNDYGTSVPYEPNGTTSVEYKFSASECNRTISVKCYDQDTGRHIKTINYKTKHGEDTIIVTKIYGYRLTKFSSDQGLLETCKLRDGGTAQIYGEIYFKYYFRTALSQETMTVTVYMKKFVPVKFTERHFLFVPTGTDLSLGYGYYDEVYSRDMTLNVGDYVSLGGSYTGFSMRSNYSQYISGNFSYKWCDDYRENFGVPYTDKSWDIINATCDESELYTTFDESKDGHYTYCTNLVSCIDFYFNRNKYTVTFDANGGSGSLPASQTQYYEYDVTIGTEAPTRHGYVFKGWSKSSTATYPSYAPGDTYTMGLNQTLYAVWDKYEFSISNLTVTVPERLYPNTVIGVRVRTDNWSRLDAYDDIPVELYYDNRLLSTEYVDFAAYGMAYVSYNLDIGSSVGIHTIEVRINWNKRNMETDSTNNRVITTVEVVDEDYSFIIEALDTNARYTEDTDVITSYLVLNNGKESVYPDIGLDAYFHSFYYDNSGEKITLNEQTWDNYVIPAKENNLVYFKWHIPDGLADITLYCECSINTDGTLDERDLSDNTATLTTVIAPKRTSQTVNPSYAASKPSDYISPTAPSVTAGSASWNMWEYEGGGFVLKEYGIKISAEDAFVYPSCNCDSAYLKDGSWRVGAGYGVSVVYLPAFTNFSEYQLPVWTSYTNIQTVYATFPEYRYSEIDGEYRVLEYADGAWCFVENEGADDKERLHYTPVWCEDGDYVISLTISDMWTPAGMITATRNTHIVIDGSLYDDWYERT